MLACRLAGRIIGVCCGIGLALVCNAAEVPRLWKAERIGPAGKTTVYLLAISHSGSSFEQGPYFQTRVVPAFMSADVLELEKPVIVAERVPECPTPLQGAEARYVLDDLKDLVRYGSTMRMVRTFQLVPQLRNVKDPEKAAAFDAAQDAATLSEYGLIVAMQLNAAFLRSDASAASSESRQPPAPRSTIAVLRNLRPGLSEISIDEPADIVNAYCNAGDARLALLKQFIEQNDVRHAYGLSLAPPEQADAAASEMLSSMLESGQGSGLTSRTFVCPRNATWARRLSKLDDGRTYFVAVGSAHLVTSIDEHGPLCEGLQSDLKDRGFEVTQVR